MSEYAMSVFVICIVSGICITLCMGQGNTERLAVGVIILWVVISPIAQSLSHFDPEPFFDSIENTEYEEGSQLDEYIEDAFTVGIINAISEKFSINEEDIRIRLYDFDKTKLSAQRIMIILSGRAIFADYKAIEKYINEMNIGECEVEIEIG